MTITPKVNPSFKVTCKYVLQEKHPEKNPEILASHGVRTDSAAHMAEDFDTVRTQQRGVGKAVLHVMISLSPEEFAKATNQLLCNLTRDYLREMGISAADTQWSLVRHNNKEHPHAHLILNRVDLNGQVVSDKFCEVRSIEASRQLERKYGLLEAEHEGRKHARAIGPTPAQAQAKTPRQQQQADWGRARHDIARALDNTRGQARSFDDLEKLLQLRGIAQELTQHADGRVKGVVFVLNGHRIKGSQLGKDCGAGQLEASFTEARQADKASEQAQSVKQLGQEYDLAKLLDGYSQAKKQEQVPQYNRQHERPTPSKGLGIGE